MDDIVDAEHPHLDQQRTYQWLAASAMVLVGCGTVVFRLLEDWSWVDAFYFSVVAATTVGFGDLSPTRDASKLFSIVYIVVGISIIAAYLDARFKKHAGRRVRRGR
ncbi:MAG: potassium channel family protein [Acidimicrobiia bacterium]